MGETNSRPLDKINTYQNSIEEFVKSPKKPSNLFEMEDFKNVLDIEMKSLKEDFKILRMISKGTTNNSFVKKAIRKKDFKLVAIRTVKKEGIDLEDMRQFGYQLKLHKEIIRYCPILADILGIYESPKKISVVMEICKGGELFDIIAGPKRLKENELAVLAYQLLDGLRQLHTKKLVHGNICLENILLLEKNNINKIKIIGLSMLTAMKDEYAQLTNKHFKKLKSFYMAPEQAKGFSCFKTDLWSLGVVLYIMVCGYPPFSEQNQEQTLHKVQFSPLHFEEKDWKDIGRDCRLFIEDLLEKEIGKRLDVKEAFKHPWINKMNDSIKRGSMLRPLSSGIFDERKRLEDAVEAFIKWYKEARETLRRNWKFIASEENLNIKVFSREDINRLFILFIDGQSQLENALNDVFSIVKKKNHEKVTEIELILSTYLYFNIGLGVNSSQLTITDEEILEISNVLDNLEDNFWNGLISSIEKPFLNQKIVKSQIQYAKKLTIF